MSSKPSFADLVKQGPFPKPMPKPRKLSPDELGRVFQGLAPKPPRNINAVYVTGIKAQKITHLKSILKTQCDVSLRNILSIDFIGKSVTEFHIYSDYIGEFKRLLTAACPTVKFVELDPLDTALLKNVAAEDRAARACAMYSKRLERRLKASPISAHRRFLRNELERVAAARDLMAVDKPSN
jgi:hypothetical protein